MKKFTLLFSFLLFLAVPVSAQYYQWSAAFTGGTYYDEGQCIAVDDTGNVYTAGFFRGTMDFDPGPATVSLTGVNINTPDIFITKQDAAGNLLWAKMMGGNGYDQPEALVLDATGNLYLTGHFESSADFDPGAATFTLTSAGNYDAFVCKLTNAGNFSWAFRIGGSGNQYGTDITLDPSGDLLLGGVFSGTIDCDPGAGVTSLSSVTDPDIFICKFTTAAALVWAKAITGTGAANEWCNAIACDVSGNVYATGTFSGTTDFDPGAGITNLTAASPNWDLFVCRLDASGNFGWAKQLSASGFVFAYDMAVDAAQQVYLAGSFNGTMDFDPGPGTASRSSYTPNYQDAFCCKLDASGNYTWVKTIGGADHDEAHDVVLDAAANIYISGISTGAVDYDPGAGTFILPGFSNTAGGYLQKLDSAGNFQWAGEFYATPNQLALGPWQTLCCTGKFSGTVDFDPGAATGSQTASVSSDVFVFKWAQCLSGTSTLNITSCDAFTLNANTYSASGTYTQHIPTSLGCDSTITLNLVIRNSSTATISQTACDSFTLNNTTYHASGTYIQTLSNAAGCDSTITLNLVIHTVDTSVTAVTNTLAANANGAAYQWMDCTAQSPVAGANSQVFAPTVNGSYAVIVTQNGCSDTSSCYAVISLGAEAATVAASSSVFPNPASGYFFVDHIVEDVRIDVFAVSGQLVLTQQQAQPGPTKITLNAAGVYLVRLTDANGNTTVQRVILQ